MDVMLLDAFWHINKYNDYGKLLKLFEEDPMLVVRSKQAHSLILELAKTAPKLKYKKTKNTPKEHAKWEYLVQKVFAYNFLGWPLYTNKTYDDAPCSDTSVKRVCDWCIEKGVDGVSQSNLTKHVKRYKKNKRIVITHALIPHIAEIYYNDKDRINLSAVKENAKGTCFDSSSFPEFWEELGGKN